MLKLIVNALKPSNQGYFNPDDDSDKGTLINFIKTRLGTLFTRDYGKISVECLITGNQLLLLSYIYLQEYPENMYQNDSIM